MTEKPRSPQVIEAQHKFLETHKVCIVCSSTTGIQAHHKIPYEYLVVCDRESIASEQWIFLALCETETGKPELNHHICAHGFDFKHVDLHFEEKISLYQQFKTFEEIETAPIYHATLLSRFKKVTEMTAEDITTMQNLIDSLRVQAQKGGLV